ncbi:unnamed protein product [Amoebophrya sp. A120]|nr:unnamed protein product [Amoebophrya sp. A120]|eukprot:GSA120T00016040001.1
MQYSTDDFITLFRNPKAEREQLSSSPDNSFLSIEACATFVFLRADVGLSMKQYLFAVPIYDVKKLSRHGHRHGRSSYKGKKT